jgi:dihydroorotate dehydrogenase (fumarate)
MADLSVKYMGLHLKNPIIVGSSGLSQSIDDLRKLEDSGVGAVVVRSMFEEQIYLDADYKRLNPDDKNLNHIEHFETLDYTEKRVRREYLSSFVKTIEEAKEKLQIPVISSINCISARGWMSFATRLQDAGADAIELNIAIQPFSPVMSAADIEQLHLEIIYKVRDTVDIPVAVKISPYFSDMSRVIDHIAQTGVNGIVLFNRFISPDIDIEKMKVTFANRYSSTCEMSNPLRWVAMKSETTPCDLCASTGIHNGADVIKILLAGGAATQIVSTIYKNGAKQVALMLDEMNNWMAAKGYGNIGQFAGIMRHHVETDTPASYERMQFMKYYR